MVRKLTIGILCSVAECVVAKEDDSRQRLEPYDPNYFVYRSGSEDDDALRARYSFSYTLWRISAVAENENSCPQEERKNLKHSVYLSYTGEFDFYLGSRESDPVINRISNPALHYRYNFDRKEKTDTNLWLDVSLEHLSNGQSENVSTPRGAERAARAYSENDYEYFDTISRSSHFLAMEANYKNSFTYQFKVKAYLREPESGITWGELAGQGVSLKDYDRYKMVVRKRFDLTDRTIELAANWTLGDEFIDTDSFEMDFTCELWNIPFFVKYHQGPLMTLSNYALEDSYIGFGINLVP